MTVQAALGARAPAAFRQHLCPCGSTLFTVLYFSSSSVMRLLFTLLQHYFYTSAKALPDPLPLKRTLINPLIMTGMQETARVERDGAVCGPTAVTILGSESW